MLLKAMYIVVGVFEMPRVACMTRSIEPLMGLQTSPTVPFPRPTASCLLNGSELFRGSRITSATTLNNYASRT